MKMSRRTLFQRSSAFAMFSAVPQYAVAKGPDLVQDKDGVVDLPRGFSYRIISRVGDTMADGYRVPVEPDGMATFPTTNPEHCIIMRNHEVGYDSRSGGAYPRGEGPDEAYTRRQLGGVTRIVYDLRNQRTISENLVLTGTTRNCAGGPSPWGWFSCEEVFADHHGYVFLCDPRAETVQHARRVDAYGRFMHEAVAIDPQNYGAYLTEDRGDGCLYRFVPESMDLPFGPGVFAALGIRGQRGKDLIEGVTVGEPLPVEWIACENPTPRRDTLRADMRSLGAARISRGEGIWYRERQIYFTATNGGTERLGQVWQYDVDAEELTLLFESPDKYQMQMPDNVATHPDGRLFICEDGPGGEVPYLRVLNQRGEVHTFARNRQSDTEFAGFAFPPMATRCFLICREMV